MKKFAFLVWFVTAFVSENLYSQSLAERNDRLLDWNPTRRAVYEEIVRYYSSLIYHDAQFEETEFEENGAVVKRQVHSPFDVIVSPFYDGNSDLQDNVENLKLRELEDGSFGRAFPLKPRIPAMIKETESHLYIEMFIYHPLDAKAGSRHLNDSEKIWIVLKILNPEFDSNDPETLEWLFHPEKSSEPALRLEFVALDAHAYPQFYAPDPEVQALIRANFEKHLDTLPASEARKIRFMSRAAFVVDRNAIHHHDTCPPVFLEGRWGEPANLLSFQCAEGHALYMLNPKAWADEGRGKGFVYICGEVGEETSVVCENFPEAPAQPTATYSVLLFDDVLFEAYLPEKLSDETREAIRNGRNFRYQKELIFDTKRTQKDWKMKFETSVGKLRPRPGLPRVLVGEGNLEPKATLPGDWGMKSHHTLSVPHDIHRWLDPDNQEISDVYVFNPWVEYVE